MLDLIEALVIFAKYEQPAYPTYCNHDVLYVVISNAKISKGDLDRLDELGFIWDENVECFMSYKFGSC